MRPIVVVGVVFAIGLAIAALAYQQRQAKFAKERQLCEEQLHLLAKRLETARWHALPQRYVTCLAELEQINGQRVPEYENYRYRVEGDGQNYEVACKTGHGDFWPVYSNRRGLHQGTPTR